MSRRRVVTLNLAYRFPHRAHLRWIARISAYRQWHSGATYRHESNTVSLIQWRGDIGPKGGRRCHTLIRHRSRCITRNMAREYHYFSSLELVGPESTGSLSKFPISHLRIESSCLITEESVARIDRKVGIARGCSLRTRSTCSTRSESRSRLMFWAIQWGGEGRAVDGPRSSRAGAFTGACSDWSWPHR